MAETFETSVEYAKILVFNTSGQLVDIPQGFISGSFTDSVNGGSAAGQLILPRTYLDTGLIGYDYRVQVYLPDSVYPWYDGWIQDFIPQTNDQQDSEQITLTLQGWQTFMGRAIVSEVLTPSATAGQMNADTYLAHLLSVYLDSAHFGTSYIISMPIALSALTFDGENLNQCIDDVVTNVQDNTGNTFEWWVRGMPAPALPAVVIQPNQNPGAVTTGRIAPTSSTQPVSFIFDYRDSMTFDDKTQNTSRTIFNLIAAYGGQDPATNIQIYGAFKDSTSISLYGVRQQKITNSTYVSTTTLSNWATAWLLLNAYPQPQRTYSRYIPTDAMRGGQWVQVFDSSIGLGTQAIRQMRCIEVTVKIDQTTGKFTQDATLTAPLPYIDHAYYAAINQAANAATTAAQYPPAKTTVYCVLGGLSWLNTYVSSGQLYVRITPGSGLVGNDYIQTGAGSDNGNFDVALEDAVSSATGDGYYEVVFAENPNASYGISGTTPALVCIKGKTPYDPTVLKVAAFTVVNNAVYGYRDLRAYSGSTLLNSPFAAGTPGAGPPDSIYLNITLNGSSSQYCYECYDDTTTYSIGTGDYLEYDIFYNPANPNVRGGFESYFSDAGASLRSLPVVDQNGFLAHPGTETFTSNLGSWYHRKFALSSINLAPGSDWFAGWNLSAGIVAGTGGPSYVVDGTTFNGDIEYTGTGSASGFLAAKSISTTVVPGQTYIFTCWVDPSHISSGSCVIQIDDPTFATTYKSLSISVGASGFYSTAPWTCPGGVTQVGLLCDTTNCTVAIGDKLKWAQPMLTVGSAAPTTYISSLAFGRTMKNFFAALDCPGDGANTWTIQIGNIRITDGNGTVRKTLYASGAISSQTETFVNNCTFSALFNAASNGAIAATINPIIGADNSYAASNIIGNRQLQGLSLDSSQVLPSIYSTFNTNVLCSTSTWANTSNVAQTGGTTLTNGAPYYYNVGAVTYTGSALPQQTAYLMPAGSPSSCTFWFEHQIFSSGAFGNIIINFTGSGSGGSTSPASTSFSGGDTAYVVYNSQFSANPVPGSSPASYTITQSVAVSGSDPLTMNLTSVVTPADGAGDSFLTVTLKDSGGTLLDTWTNITTAQTLTYNTAHGADTFTWKITANSAATPPDPYWFGSFDVRNYPCSWGGTLGYFTTTPSTLCYMLATDGVTKRTNVADANVQFITNSLLPNSIGITVYSNNASSTQGFSLGVQVEGL